MIVGLIAAMDNDGKESETMQDFNNISIHESEESNQQHPSLPINIPNSPSPKMPTAFLRIQKRNTSQRSEEPQSSDQSYPPIAESTKLGLMENSIQLDKKGIVAEISPQDHNQGLKVVEELLIKDNVQAALGSSLQEETPSNQTDLRPEHYYSPAPIRKSTEDDEYDIFGFKKQTNWVSRHEYDQWHSEYVCERIRRKGKWDTLLEAHKDVLPPKNAMLKRYIRKGIPVEYRGECWYHYSGAEARAKRNPNLYKQLLQQGVPPEKFADADMIERDLHRTFPENLYYKQVSAKNGKESDIVMALRRVLTAFAIHTSKNQGYCQSLNFLAGILLLFLDEEKVFWQLLIITEKFLPGMHDVLLEGVSIDQAVLMIYVRENLSAVWKKISFLPDGSPCRDVTKQLPTVCAVTVGWLMSVYCTTLPTETFLRVWDVFFAEGPHVLFRVALALFKSIEPHTSAMKDPTNIFQILQNTPKTMIEPKVLLDQCFKKNFNMALGNNINNKDVERVCTITKT